MSPGMVAGAVMNPAPFMSPAGAAGSVSHVPDTPVQVTVPIERVQTCASPAVSHVPEMPDQATTAPEPNTTSSSNQVSESPSNSTGAPDRVQICPNAQTSSSPR
jgi:hypothetical protein